MNVISGTLYAVTVEDLVLRELHRAAGEAGRPGVAIPSKDLTVAARLTGGRVSAKQALARLAAAGRVVRVRKNLVVLPDATGLLNVEIDGLVEVIAPKPYLITAGAALERAGLIDQHYFTMAVLVPAEVAPLTYRAQTAEFYKTDPGNIWGARRAAGPAYASPERAILDAVNHPRYGVSITRCLDALIRAEARDPEFLDGLLAATRRYGTRGHGARSAARRLGLIVERTFGADKSAPYLDLIGSNRASVLLRPGGSPEGSVDSTWRVVVNAIVEPEIVR